MVVAVHKELIPFATIVAKKGTLPEIANFNQCDFFHRHGHVEADCRTKKREQREVPPNPKESFFFRGDGEAMMALDDITTSHGMWLGDSGASHHTTHDMNNFSSFTQLDKPYKI